MRYELRKLETGWCIWDRKINAPTVVDGRWMTGLETDDAEHLARVLNLYTAGVVDKPFEVVDPSDLTDGDWAEISELRRAYTEGGKKALKTAMIELAKDSTKFTTIIRAFFPDMLRDRIRDAMAEIGMTEEELLELKRKLE